VWALRTPKNISYFWGFGRFLGIVIVIQIASGFLLACYYVSGQLGWDSVIEITREVYGGWILRLIHGNTASFVFIILFVHFLRGLVQRSFYLAGPWISGWLIKVLVMASAFLGYVLPWGQISFWGATVIINLLSILPKGKILVIWLWGGFYVSSFTCRFFYALHFLVPLVVLVIAGVHLLLLHSRGSSVPGGIRRFWGLFIKFSHFFRYKDTVNFIIFWAIIILCFAFPDWSADPVNFIASDLSNSPLHIQPEWYFLHLYAVLRSIPNKIGGLIGFFLALFLLSTLSLVFANHRLAQFKIYNSLVWTFISANLILLWLGIQPVEDPYVFIGQLSATVYFVYFGAVFSFDIRQRVFL